MQNYDDNGEIMKSSIQETTPVNKEEENPPDIDPETVGSKRTWLISKSKAEIIGISLGVLGFIISLVNLVYYINELDLRNSIECERLIDEAWDYLCGENGQPLVGAKYKFPRMVDQRNTEIAKRLIEEAAKLNKNSPGVLKLEAELLYSQNKLKEALRKVELALENDQKHAPACQLKGMIYEANNDIDTAISTWKYCKEIAPKEPSIYDALAGAYRKKGNKEEAISILNEALKFAPDNFLILQHLGSIYIDINPEKAKSYLKKTILIYSNSIYAHCNLGKVYMNEGKWDEALVYFKTAINLDRTFAFAYTNLGICLENKGEDEKAIENLQMAIALNPEEYEGRIALARLYRKAGKTNKANELENEARTFKAGIYRTDRYGRTIYFR